MLTPQPLLFAGGAVTLQNLERGALVSRLNRRALLHGSVATLFAPAMSGAKAQNSHAVAAGSFPVKSGEGRLGNLWMVHGDKAFATKVSGRDTGGTYAAIEVHTPPGRGPELHVHREQSELFFLLSGSIGMQCGSDRTVLHEGDAYMAAANVPHAYVTLGKEPARMLNVFDPAGQIEGFFAEYASLINVSGPPDTGKIAATYAKHGMQVLGPPLKAASFASL